MAQAKQAFNEEFPHRFTHTYESEVDMDRENERLTLLAGALKRANVMPNAYYLKREENGFTFAFKTQMEKAVFWINAYDPKLEPKCEDLTYVFKSDDPQYLNDTSYLKAWGMAAGNLEKYGFHCEIE